jgi:hypothetical protein
MNDFMLTADQMEARDRADGIQEVCVDCGKAHWIKSPLCAECAEAEAMMEVAPINQIGDNEPIFWEVV